MSNGDIGLKGRKERERLNTTGTNHGSIECVNGQWYVFYHRNTNKTAYSRQACAEPITIEEDGSIAQVEITSQGLNHAPLPARGIYPVAICCNLTNGRMPHQGNGIVRKKIPYIRGIGNECIVIATNGTMITYKYFDFSGGKVTLRLRLRGKSKGNISVYVSEVNEAIGFSVISKTSDWIDLYFSLIIPSGTRALSLYYTGKEELELKELEFI